MVPFKDRAFKEEAPAGARYDFFQKLELRKRVDEYDVQKHFANHNDCLTAET